MVNDGSITDPHIGSPGDAVPDDLPFGNRAEIDANSDGFLNRGDGCLNTGNGILDPGEDVNGNGLLEFGEDFDEDSNLNGPLDGPDNVITGNGITLGGTGSGIVLRTLPTEDLNSNGLLEVGEDINGNGRLDFGGGVITAGLAKTYLDNTVVLDASGNPILSNNTGSQLEISADGGSLGTGSITVSSISNNSMTGAGVDAITIDAANSGTVLIGRLENNTLGNGVARGISVTADTATVDLGTIDNNTINRIVAGTDAVWITGVNSSLAATLIRNRISGDVFYNIDTAGGVSVFLQRRHAGPGRRPGRPGLPGRVDLRQPRLGEPRRSAGQRHRVTGNPPQHDHLHPG